MSKVYCLWEQMCEIYDEDESYFGLMYFVITPKDKIYFFRTHHARTEFIERYKRKK